MDREHWMELALAACRHAGIGDTAIEIIATWDQRSCANAVYRIGGRRILKLFGPSALRQFFVERAVLRTLAQQETIPAPRILAEGERAPQAPYLVLGEVAGSTAEDRWDDLCRADQLALAHKLGALTRALHRLPQDNLAAVEQQFGGRRLQVEKHRPRRMAEIECAETLSPGQRRNLMRFLLEEAPQHLDGSPVLTHAELAHNHIYLAQEAGAWKVAGIIDWADAVLGPPEWDVTYLYFWTFSGDREAMRVCLNALYADDQPPQRFARRCLAATMYASTMNFLWSRFAEQGIGSEDIVRDMTAFFFPPDLFGAPD